MIDDFGGDNFDHSGLGFIGGHYIGAIMTNGRPIEFHPTPPGTPKWGLRWKQAVTRHYNHTIVHPLHGTSTRHAATTSTSTRPTRTPGASRCCA